jgi:ATP-dependent helicase/nuclease subunit A
MDEIELVPDPDFQFTDDQAEVMSAYHTGSGRVCVGAGAGTGKTTTLTRVVTEAVIEMCQPNVGLVERNPFDEILVTTFTRDAAGQLKSKIKQQLRDHERYGSVQFDPAVWRWIETDNNIGTIDSFVGSLLREIAPEVRVAPGFEVRDELETQDLLRELVRDLRADDDLEDALELIDSELEGTDTSTGRYLYDIHQKLREFCYVFPDQDSESGTTMFSRHLCELIHQGQEPPFEAEDVQSIVAELTGTSPTSVTAPDEVTREQIADDYRYSLQFAEAVEASIDAFDRRYDRRTRETGALSYQDITYVVWEYLQSEEGAELAETLSHRFSHVFIDEFQDTSYAQCQILSALISNDDEDPTQVLVIGDVKQSIYGWRSADPEIFARILEHAAADSSGPDPYLQATDWTRAELVTNFRSHPHLVRSGNHLFSTVFESVGMGAIGTFPIEFEPLVPHRPETSAEQARLHVLPLGDCSADTWRARDPRRVAETIHGIVESDSVTVGDGGDERPARAGDVTLLFRRSYHMPTFREELDAHGLQNAVVADRGLFQTREVSFLIDVLDWFANPHSKDSLLRILRSPVTALDDRTLRFLTSHDLNLPRALDQWPDTFDVGDRKRLEMLLDLRNDLRWDREGPKSTLVQKIIQHTAIETILLAGEDATQRYGNLWMLVEVVRDWEEDELLAYREFVERLQRYQEMARSGDATFEVAQVADSSADDTVKLRTVHSSKGLEFDIVVLADLLAGPGGRPEGAMRAPYRDPETGARELGLRPRPADEPVEFGDGPGSVWIQDDYASTLWYSTNRDSDGDLRHDHPYSPALRDQLAEFWRLLYVAFTRAGDHVLLPLGDSIHYTHKWRTWAHALLMSFQTGGEWMPDDQRTTEFELRPEALHPQDVDGPASVPLGVGDLPTENEVPANPIGLPDIEMGDPEEAAEQVADSGSWKAIGFAPRELRPSTLHDLIACPRRFQYRALQEVSEARGRSPPGSNAPQDISPSYWGTIVHDALERLHLDVRECTLNEDESQLGAYLESNSEIAEPIRGVVEQYRTTTVWAEVGDAETILPEYELAAMYQSEPQVHLSGFVDLLYERDGEWHIVDFKTGQVPESGSYLSDQYRWQLATYAWLLREEYDIVPSSTRVVYVQSGTTEAHDIDWSQFSDWIGDLPNRLDIESEQGLPTRPDPEPEGAARTDLPLESRCGSCPYNTICPEWSG